MTSVVPRHHSDCGYILVQSQYQHVYLHLLQCIAQTISKGEQRIVEIAVCTSLHRIILKIRQLRVILIECDRQFSTWVTITKQHISNSSTSLLASIPCLDNGVASLCLRSKSNSRTRTVYEYNLLPGLLQCLKEVTLYLPPQKTTLLMPFNWAIIC